ncbi:hypothetical protein NLI96_g6473 [Meripilus lineatus]|uniref:Protein kinase domain-containing protein n=1 Tax=Meripilus lineatus TaxID=2056292 RepID=A0AAD5V2N0_9APHY|nr:hypothetical protein NLI96_g6473 [Physisporinus lineatus]
MLPYWDVVKQAHRLVAWAWGSSPSPPETADSIRRAAPILVDWLHRASPSEPSPSHVRIQGLLQSAFENGTVSEIYGLSNADTDIALSIMLNAYDVSREDREELKNGARRILVDLFRGNASKLKRLPSCLMLNTADIVVDSTVEPIDGRTTLVYVGSYRGTPVAIKTAPADDSKLFFTQSISRRELAVWRTLFHNDSEHVVPLLGIANIEITAGAKPETVLIMPLLSKYDVVSHLADQWVLPSRTLPMTPFLENILLDEDDHAWLGGLGGSGLALKVAIHTKTGITQQHRRQFLAPEQVGKENFYIPTQATDIWAFGLCCNQFFLGGQGPWAQRGAVPEPIAISEGVRPSKPDEMDDDLWHIVNDCFAMNPADRPTAKELLSRMITVRSVQHAIYQYLGAPPTSDLGSRVFKRMEVFTRERALVKATSPSSRLASILSHSQLEFQALLHSNSVPASHADTSSAQLARIEVRPVLIALGVKTGLLPSQIQSNQDALVLTDDADARKISYQATLYGRQVTVTCRKNNGDRRPLLDAAPNLEDAEDSDDTEGAARRTFYKEYHKLLGKTAEAMKYLHDEGIIHSNIRGTSILVDRDNNVFLSDFSRSRIEGLDESLSSQFTGAYGWLAPELQPRIVKGMRGPRDEWSFQIYPPAVPTTASDVYSFGCLCIELYACKNPEAALETVRGSIKNLIKSDVRHIAKQCCGFLPKTRPNALELTQAKIDEIEAPVKKVQAPFQSQSWNQSVFSNFPFDP